MIVIYARASSSKQTTQSQRADLERWLAGYLDEPHMWVEEIASGTTMDRPKWNEVSAMIDAGEVDTLVVWRLDRLGRSASGLVELFERLTELGVNLVSIKDGINLDTPAGRMIARVIASIAVYENEVKTERVRAGIAAAKERGVKWGGSEKGWRSAAVKRKVKGVLMLFDAGGTVTECANAYKMSKHTAYKILEERGRIQRADDGSWERTGRFGSPGPRGGKQPSEPILTPPSEPILTPESDSE